MSFQNPSSLGADIQLTEFSIASETRGDIIRRGATAWERVPIGTADQYLRSDGTNVAWAVNPNKLELLDSHKATGTEASYTFTPAAALNMLDTYASILVIIGGEATASFQLLIELNGVNAGTEYSRNYIMNDSGTISAVFSTGNPNIILIPAALIDIADRGFVGQWYITLGEDAICSVDGQAGASREGNVVGGGGIQGVDLGGSTITEIKLLTSTSTWKADTKIDIYGVKRT